jgi:repressor LexA
MLKFLTKKQKEFLDYIQDYIGDNGFAPSFDDIRSHFKFKSFGTVQDYFKILEDKGYVRRSPNQARGITIVEEDLKLGQLVNLPLYGFVAAGAPIEVCERQESIAVPQSLISRKPCYVLQVKGNSMVEDHILDGDFIVVEQKQTAENGEVVVALIDNSAATLKRFYREKNRIRLEPANSAMKPIYVRDVAVQGKVVGLFRRIN